MEWFNQVESTAEWLKSFGIWAILVSLLINIIISLFGVIPSVFLSGANAVVFGIVGGFWISLAGEVLGAGVSFWLYRWGIKRVKGSRKEWGWVKRLDSVSRWRQNLLLLIARITPMMPSGVITFAAAASSMVFLDFMVVSLIGKAPSIALETIIGHDLFLLQDNTPRLLLTLSLVAVGFLILRRKKPRSSGEQQ